MLRKKVVVVVRHKKVTKKLKLREPIYLKIGVQINLLRGLRNMRQEDLGKAIGVSRASIANMEAGRQRILLHQLQAVARALNTPLLNFLRDLNEERIK